MFSNFRNKQLTCKPANFLSGSIANNVCCHFNFNSKPISLLNPVHIPLTTITSETNQERNRKQMCDQDGAGVGSSISMPVPVHSRMDRLDSLMKYLEEKQNSCGWGGSMNSNHGVQKQGTPLDLAVRDIHTKGTILDRVASLENRLFQLCLEIEASSTSARSYAAHTSDNTSDRQGSTTTDQSHSLENMEEEIVNSTDDPTSFHRALVSRFKFLGNSVNDRMISPSQVKQVIIPEAETKEDTSKNDKKFKARSRRWKRIIGC